MLTKIKALLGIGDTSKDRILNILIEQAVTKAAEYTHNYSWYNLGGVPSEVEPILVQWVIYMYQSGETNGAKWVLPELGEVKKESYSGVSFEYITAEDYTANSSNINYFDTYVAPYLRGRRKVQTIGRKN